MSNGNQPLGPPSAGDLPPPYSPYGAPAPIGEPTPYSAIEAISYGGSKLIQNLGSMILVAFGIYLLGGLVQGITSVLQTLVGTVGSTVETCHPSESGAVECITHHNGYLALDLTITGLVFLVSILGAVGTMFLQAGLVRGGFMIVDGQTPSISTMFSGWAKGPYLIIMFLTGIIITIGVMLLIIPGIVAAVFLLWVPALAVDRGDGPILEPIRQSFELVRENLGQSLLFCLLALLITILGVLMCCIGLLATTPLLAIAMAYSVRSLQGRPITP
ncbi:MAG TPA: hypothetical protein PKX56_08815 [Marmoricola sp.]|nr:hypothetical protein [Marmoricola sp.]HNN47521.1 hypothetical protein [Marmoricola sp.]